MNILEQYFRFLHGNIIFMHGNIIFMHGNVIFMHDAHSGQKQPENFNVNL